MHHNHKNDNISLQNHFFHSVNTADNFVNATDNFVNAADNFGSSVTKNRE